MSRPVQSENLRLMFGLKVRAYRLERHLSLKQLAASSGLAVSYLSEIEQGRKYPKPEKMLPLADALGVAYDELVSLQVDASLDPLADLLASDLVREFPFELFGFAPRDLVHLFSDEPRKARAFLQTFVEIGRTYDMSVENFLLSALRTWQKQHGNHFPELEEAAAAFRDAHPDLGTPADPDRLAALLADEFGVVTDATALAPDSPLSGFRSVYRRGPRPVLHVNPRLLPSQRAFVLGREIGFRLLGLDDVRPDTSSWVRVESFEHLVNNFRASYFAGALLLPEARLVPDLEALLAQPAWREESVRDLLHRHRATPEMFLYRLSQLLPGRFGLDQLFYLRFTREVATGEITLTKELNLSGELVPYGLGLREHYCRRWLPLRQLIDRAPPDLRQSREPVIGLQRVRFLESGNDFLLVSMARPLSLTDARQSAMTVGFGLSGTQAGRLGFAADPGLETVAVNETCERCALAAAECRDRVAPPLVHEQHSRQQAREDALRRLLAAPPGVPGAPPPEGPP
ncbi:helix-turn-helix domain-containing protein [bacterium]|nr:helix-turn-helix domain-containing protein [bacterium]